MRLLLLLTLAACTKAPPKGPTGSDAVHVDANLMPIPDAASAKEPQMLYRIYYHEEGAPDPLACETDAECTGDTIFDETGCCIASPTPFAQTRTYHDWIATHRQTACADIMCPSPPVPTVAEECLFDVRCVSGSCVNGCR